MYYRETYQLHEAEFFLWTQKFPSFMEPKCSLQRSQERDIGVYPELIWEYC
jgi:hypothetical protein